MGASRRGFVVIVLAVCCFGSSVRADADNANFLLNPNVSVVRSAKIVSGKWSHLLDGNSRTTCIFECVDGAAEVVLCLGEKTGSVRGWSVSPAEKKNFRAELLSSALSSDAGFSVRRADLIAQGKSATKLSFRSRGAKYLLLRFTPLAPDSKSVSLADVAVRGSLGAPETKYEFRESPARALDVLSKMQQADELKIMISKDETSLFADARDGKFDEWSLAEAALLASGVMDKRARAKLLKQVDRLESEAAAAVSGRDDANLFRKGDALLRWLHREDGPLSAGYESKQTRLNVLLKTKKFNCVSSAVIYNILAKRLGIDARAIEVPDHVFSIVYDGSQHADVETTNAAGFNPARDLAAQRQFEQQTGLRYIPDSHRDSRREISEAGLVALIYYNRGVTNTTNKQYHRALLAYFRAMSMDKEFHSAVKNALAGLVNWGNEQLERNEFESATRVIATGLALAPDDASLLHNQDVAFTKWAMTLADDKQYDQALDVLRRAAKIMPGDEFVSMQATIFVRQGELQIDKDAWPAALKVADTALAKVDEGARPNVMEWHQSILLRWADSRLGANDFARSVELLEQGMNAYPEEGRFAKNLIYSVQEWAQYKKKEQGSDKARDLLLTMVDRFPKVDGVRDVASNYARNTYVSLRDKGQFQAAIDSVESNDRLLDEKSKRRLLVDAHQSWSSSFIRSKDWNKAVDSLEKALAVCPKESRFEQNLAYSVHHWAQAKFKSDGVEPTKALLKSVQDRFKARSRVTRSIEGFIQSVVSDRLKKNDPELSPWKTLDSFRGILKSEREANLARIIADQQASAHRKQGRWEDALSAYDEGLRRFPDDGHMHGNAVATWHAWARPSLQAKKWDAAISVYQDALMRFPDERSFTLNIEYCKHNAKKE